MSLKRSYMDTKMKTHKNHLQGFGHFQVCVNYERRFSALNNH